MAKKNRAARKQQRQRAARAAERGLPQSTLEPSLSRASGAAARRRGGSTSGAHAELRETEGKWPTAVKVAIGVVIALLLVFIASEFRKGERFSSASTDVSPSPELSPETAELSAESAELSAETAELPAETAELPAETAELNSPLPVIPASDASSETETASAQTTPDPGQRGEDQSAGAEDGSADRKIPGPVRPASNGELVEAGATPGRLITSSAQPPQTKPPTRAPEAPALPSVKEPDAPRAPRAPSPPVSPQAAEPVAVGEPIPSED